MKLELIADKVLMRGPRIDGSFVISFEVGEYEKAKLAKLLEFRTDEIINITLEQKSEKSD